MMRNVETVPIILFVICIFTISNQIDPEDAVDRFMEDSDNYIQKEPDEPSELREEYDVIIIGAGTAGCVLANRLSEVKSWNILLIEAGDDEIFLMDVPILATMLQFTEANWGYKTEPQPNACLGMKGKRCNLPRGKVTGGSSVLNNMIHTRGHPEDYDHWASLGNKDWDWNSILPYFLKSEDMKIQDSMVNKECHSKGGYLTIDRATWSTPLTEAFMAAAKELGEDIVDYNGRQTNGYSRIQFTLRNGSRLSTNTAFLQPASQRQNLDVSLNSHVTKILIDPITKQAYGVEYTKDLVIHRVKATKEVIVSAGAINSPQILMLSGIGPQNHLKKFGIPVIADLNVGENLQDHIALGGLTFLVNDSVSIRTDRILKNVDNVLDYMAYHVGPLSAPTGTEAIGFISTQNKSSLYRPDLELLFTAGSYVSEENYKTAFGIDYDIYNTVYKPIENKDTWMILPMLLLPKSKGKIQLRDANPMSQVLIYANYLKHPEEYEIILEGIRRSILLSKTKALQKYGSTLHDIPIPNCARFNFGTDDYWKCALRHLTQTIFHQCCTCKMGPETDAEAVVDERLRVRGGIKGLRVVDASIMPDIPTAHTNAPTIMIAEKAADLIKQDWKEWCPDTLIPYTRRGHCRLHVSRVVPGKT